MLAVLLMVACTKENAEPPKWEFALRVDGVPAEASVGTPFVATAFPSFADEVDCQGETLEAVSSFEEVLSSHGEIDVVEGEHLFEFRCDDAGSADLTFTATWTDCAVKTVDGLVVRSEPVLTREETLTVACVEPEPATGPTTVGLDIGDLDGGLAGVEVRASNVGCITGTSDADGRASVGNVDPSSIVFVDGRWVEHGQLALPPAVWNTGRTGDPFVTLASMDMVEGPVDTVLGTLELTSDPGAILRLGELVPYSEPDPWLADLDLDPDEVVWSAMVDSGLLDHPVTLAGLDLPLDLVVAFVDRDTGEAQFLAPQGDPPVYVTPRSGMVLVLDLAQ
ncbi:MAG: hypothetical protein KC621_08605 [Myxococcales bacterium]|nr:hypothetical protein [Myxococcales bacterium]